MPNHKLAIALTALLLLTGCSINVTRKYEQPPAPPVVIHTDDPYAEQDPTIRDIHAVRSLTFENNRFDRLIQIAQREHLGSSAQVYLIQTAAHKLTFESNRFKVFAALIENPAMDNAGRNAILDHIKSLGFDSNRVKILNKLDDVPIQYPPAPPAPYEPHPDHAAEDHLPNGHE